MEVIQIQDKKKWNDKINSFEKWDVYYLNEYAKSLQIHGDGEPNLIYYEKDGKKMAYVMMKRDIAEYKPLTPYIEKEKYFDWTTPYGYGGPLYSGELSEQWVAEFYSELNEYCKRQNIVTQFFRFHPLLQNQKKIEKYCDVAYIKKTVYVDTTNEEVIFRNMTPNNRNMVRKAKKNGIEIIQDKGERLEEFQKIYFATMQNNQAESYYYFEKEYFEYLLQEMKDNMIFFYALYDGKPISASIFFYNERYMHYHLSGTLPECRKMAATNLLLSEAASWAAGHGIKQLHLGGGVGVEDSLLSFKKHFNRNGLIDFCIGRNIFLPDEYEELVKKREENDSDFDRNRPFMIKYRG